MSTGLNIEWLGKQTLQHVFDALEAAGGEARVNGGAVRNALLGEPNTDIDLSTTLVPADVIEALSHHGIKVVKTGFDHGTVTAVIDGDTYEVTTLREDVETDGRHAIVKYGTDWTKDASRRDFTMNALYMTRDGEVLDPLHGRADLDARLVKFVGDPETRIREDYLRVLRFFRFFAQYGYGRPDAAGLKACARLKEGLSDLSAERVWQEMSKLFGAKQPQRALLWMRQSGVLTALLPESENWGIDAIHGLVDAEQAFGWTPDPIIRLASIIPPNETRVRELSKRWKLPNLVRDRLLAWADQPSLSHDIGDREFDEHLYWSDGRAVLDRLMLDIANQRWKVGEGSGDPAVVARLYGLFSRAEKYEKPALPVSGQDFLDAGIEAGPDLGLLLSQAEKKWVGSGFKASRQELLSTCLSRV
ncbi:MAG: CCA tRNA nucleotidyltransferase [Pseudomonadota bacterium]